MRRILLFSLLIALVVASAFTATVAAQSQCQVATPTFPGADSYPYRPDYNYWWGGYTMYGMCGDTQGYSGGCPDCGYGGWRGSSWDMMSGRRSSASVSLTQETPIPSEEVSFSQHVQPIFYSRCVSCHGGTANLFLNTYENVMRGGINGPAVIPNDPNGSRLIQFVSSGYMPYGGPLLTSAQVETLVNWVAAGAPNN